jgi:ABC-type phosphate transport system permease subunit
VNTALLLWGVVFGAVGLGFFVYGKKQNAIVPLACGVALMVLPYVISNLVLLLGAGAALVATPYFVRR